VFLAFLFGQPHSVDVTHHAIDQFLLGIAYDVSLSAFEIQFEADPFVELPEGYNASLLLSSAVCGGGLIYVFDDVEVEDIVSFGDLVSSRS